MRNLYIYSTADNQGLIGRLGANGKVHDLTVTGSVTTTGNTAGGIVGHAPAKTSVSNCLNEADVTAKTCVAGVVGKTQGNVANANNAKNAPAIKNCGNTGTITATDATFGNAGGIAAVIGNYQMFGGVFTDCINVGSVTASKKAGGVTVTTNGKRQADGGGNYYLSGCLNGSGDTPIIGAEKTADELMEMLKDRTDPVGKGLYEALKAQKDQAAADAVIAKINAIGTVTLDSKSAIDEARKAYDKLTAEQQARVSNYAALTAAETTFAKLVQDKADQDAADAVIAKIDAIGTVTLKSKKAIDAARKAYDIQVRKELTDEWDARGVQKGVEYAILTDEISRAWSGMSTRQYKNFKGLKKENLRDNMTTLELVLNMLAEATTTEISKQKSPGTFLENLAVAREGGEAAGIARKAVEERTGVPVITAKNAAQLNQVVTDLLEGATTSPEKQDKRH